ncbi:MAG: efflux RND transporter periplasmic adaptor subunit [Melioribacteraceae bacterium]|nr:efflux RND transporter periplasmic adaptor subunit [Melioribacteraceae bacterium]
MGKGKSKKSKKKVFILGAIVLLLFVVVGLLAFSGDKEEIITVQTEEVKSRTITQVVTATGKINPEFQVELRPEVTGEIVDLPVEEGDIVKKGQLLIRLKPEQYIARRNRARASLEAAKAGLKVREAALNQVKLEYERIKGLYEKGLVSDKELESSEALFLQSQGQYEAEKAQVMQATESYNDAVVELEKTAIYSPIDGTIIALNVELSERVLGSSFSQGTHLMTVADLSKIEAQVEVDENDVVLISIGDTAKVEIDAFKDKVFLGTVTQIANSAKTTGLGTQNEVVNFEVKIRLLNPDQTIRPGMSCDADIQTETRFNVISVPIQSVTARVEKPQLEEVSDDEEGNGVIAVTDKSKTNGKTKKSDEVVFVVDNNSVKQVKVTTGISDDNYVEIMEGLSGGEKVVSGPYRAISKDLEEGKKISVRKGSGSASTEQVSDK